MSGPSQNRRLTELPLGPRAMTEEGKRREIYDSLHKADQLRFPLKITPFSAPGLTCRARDKVCGY
jgi:hypothetical protein